MPNIWKPSVTVAAVIERDGRFLMVEEETTDGIRINQPAGHLDPGESIAAGAAREALEETAHPFTPTALLGIYMSRYTSQRTGEDVSYLRFAFVGTAGERVEGQALDEGILQALWLTPAELRAQENRLRSPLVLTCIDDYLAGKRYPLDVFYTHPSALDP